MRCFVCVCACVCVCVSEVAQPQGGVDGLGEPAGDLHHAWVQPEAFLQQADLLELCRAPVEAFLANPSLRCLAACGAAQDMNNFPEQVTLRCVCQVTLRCVRRCNRDGTSRGCPTALQSR